MFFPNILFHLVGVYTGPSKKSQSTHLPLLAALVQLLEV